MFASDKDPGTMTGEKVATIAPRTDNPTASDAVIDPEAERRLLMKLDLIIYPPFFVMYTMSFLDRINIGNARIQGMLADLDLYGNRFNIALFVYFIPYIILEIPSNMFIRKMRPSLYLSSLMFIWGIVNMCMGFVRSYGALVTLRFLLGVFEAGVLPGIIYVTSVYYKRHEYQRRLSFFFSSTVVAGAFGGLLAYAITRLGGAHGVAAWRWIFIVEGAATSGLALAAAFLIVDWPEQTRYLDAGEKELLRRRLAADVDDSCRMDTLTRFSFKLIVRDYKIWLGAVTYMGVGLAGYSGAFFLPTILVEFEWKAEEAQVRTIPVYVFAGGMMLLDAWASDKLKHRLGFILAGASMALVGFGMLLAQGGKSRDYKFAAVFLVFGGSYMVTPMALGWLQNNLSGHWKRSFGSSAQVTLGNLSGIIGSNIFLERERPSYATGYGVAAAAMFLGALSALAMFVLMRRENRKRAAGERDDRLDLPEEKRDNLGDWHPSFRFTL
ncbi:major facilitator superfamily protein [Hirsutella rhossiliensis]|uniref:Major facilitator superfamily domain-containing protein n=1 Tax=Hirsutella rhossiliensis TaxID=111463 RepID=A0A9P8N0U7_9HYPO|nr:major facilitator superfamily domain-containing protein [Hirsutella rhossiliensis]KAH0964785.1 major facilitator superfamily domain-containing protein [Hirsutella rhossiliensis]